MASKQKPKKIKFKTKKSVKKRVHKITASGEWKRGKKNTSHLFSSKKTKNKRHARKAGLIHKSDKKRLDRLIKK